MLANAITGVGNAPLIETFYLGPNLLNASADQVQAAVRNDAYWPIITSYSDPAQPTSFLAKNVKAPYADEITFSVRGDLPRRLGTGVVGYVQRDYKKLIDNFVGDVCDFGFDFGRPCPTGNTTDVFADGELVATVDSRVWANNPNAHRTYRALNLLWNVRPPSARWNVGGNYTYGRTRANYEGEGQNTPSSGSPQGDYVRAVVNASPNGFADDDIRHRLNVYGTYRLDLHRAGSLTLGSIFLYQSGLPFSLVAQVPYKDVPQYLGAVGTYTQFFGDRGSHRFPSYWRADLSTRYDLPLTHGIGAFLKLAATNVLDTHRVLSYLTTGEAVPDANGNLSWKPTRSPEEEAAGICGLGSRPSKDCSDFGRIRSKNDYQRPRTYLISVGFDF